MGLEATRKGVDVLYLTRNRHDYAQRSLQRLVSDPSDFRVFWWDNGSTDGTRDLFENTQSEKITQRYRSSENMLQEIPTASFLENCTADVIGKVDDDTLVPHGWIEDIAELVRNHPETGMIGCWTFWPDDYERNQEAAEKKVVSLGRHRVLRDLGIGGTAFLMRKEIAVRYLTPRGGVAFPVDKVRMSLDGLISGWYFPIKWAEHMDDPRSEHCLLRSPGMMQSDTAALTARLRKFSTPEQYLEWLKADADAKLSTPFEDQLARVKASSKV